MSIIIDCRLKLLHPEKGQKTVDLVNLSEKFTTIGYQPTLGDTIDPKGQISDQERDQIRDFGCQISAILYVDSRFFDLATGTLMVTLSSR